MANILIVTHNIIPDARVEKEAQSLRKAGHLAYLITPKIKDENACNSFDKVFTYSHTYKHNYFFGPAVRDAAKFYGKIVQNYKIDVIHAHNIFTAHIASKVVKKFKLKFVYDDHETWSLWLKLRAKVGVGLRKLIRFYVALRAKRIERRIAHQADHIIVTNVKCIPFYEKMKIPAEKISSIENIVLQSEIDDALKREDLVIDFLKEDKRKKLVHVYHHQKGKTGKQAKKDESLDRQFDRFVEAQEQLDDWVLVLFGNKNPELEKRGVVFIDFMPRIAYLANIAKADVGLNPLTLTKKTLISSQNRVFEFAKLGVRVISTKTPLLEENFEDKLIWMNPDDPLEKLLEILNNIETYPSGEELKEYSKKHGWEKEVNKMIEAYERILST